MKIKNIKYIAACLVLLMFLIGAASATEDSSDSVVCQGDAAAIDSISEDASCPVVDSVSKDSSYSFGESADLSKDSSYSLVESDANSIGISSDGLDELDSNSQLNETASDLIQSDTDSRLSENDVELKDFSGKTVLKDGESTTIFVSNLGSDDNSGLSSEAAVATIEKAFIIVNGMGGADFTIFIADGNYTIPKIYSPNNKNISLVGESKEGAIIHISEDMGFDIYLSNLKWNIENLTFCDMNSSSSTSSAIRVHDKVDLNISNCIFRNIGSVMGPLYITSSGNTYISNVLIEDCYGTNKNYNPSIISFSGNCHATLDNIEIRGTYMGVASSMFSKYYMGSIIYSENNAPNVTLMNSRIVDNNGSIASIFDFRGKIKIINTSISNNSLDGDSWEGDSIFFSGTYFNTESCIDISQSVIEGNVLTKVGSGIFSILYGNHNIDHSIIRDNKYSSGSFVPLGLLSSGTSLSSEFNYWGINERPNDNTDKWIVLTGDVPETQFVGVPGSISFYLDTYASSSGGYGHVEGMPDFNIGVSYALNQENPSTVAIEGGKGTIQYTGAAAGDETLTLSNGDAYSFKVSSDVSSLIYVDGSVETSGSGTSESPFKTIAEAVNSLSNDKTILVRSGTYREKNLRLAYNCTIMVDGNAEVIIDAEGDGRIFEIAGASVTMKGLTLAGGNVNGPGAAIYLSEGQLFASRLDIRDSNGALGGAIAMGPSSCLNISYSSFTNNSADSGGAIYIASSNNSAESDYINAYAEIFMNDFKDHLVSDNGGAIYVNASCPVFISSNEFNGDRAVDGESIYVEKGDIKLTGNRMPANETIYMEGGSVNSNLVFMEGKTVAYAVETDADIRAALTDDYGNAIRGGTVTFTANGENIGSVDISGNSVLMVFYTVPSDAVDDIVISGGYSLDKDGKIVEGTIHPAVPHWFIEGGSGYEFLSEAIDAASANDVIYGIPGTYTAYGMVISKNLTIKANNTGEIILDGDQDRMFAVKDSASLTLINLDMTNAGTEQGAFIDIYNTGGDLNIYNSTLRDLKCSKYYPGGAILCFASQSTINIEGSRFENINATQSAPVLLADVGVVLNIKDSSFTKISCEDSYALMQVSGNVNIERSNFTDIAGNSSKWYGAIGSTGNSNFNISECRFINIEGPEGSAIYMGKGNLTVTKSVFMNNRNRAGVIYMRNIDSANINYNLFINNTDLGGYSRDMVFNGAYSSANLSYNFFGSNDAPDSSQVSIADPASPWTVVDLSCNDDPVYMGTSPEIYIQFFGTDGTWKYALEDNMPEYSFDLTASEGSLNASSATLRENVAVLTYTPPSMVGTVTLTATPGPAVLELNVMDTSRLLVVSTDGSNDNPGTLDSPYATIAYALTQASETRNIVYLLNKGQAYRESGLTLSSDLTVMGEKDEVTIDGASEGRIFIVSGNATIKNLVLINGGNDETALGGAIYVDGGNLTANKLNISDSRASSGGAIATGPGSIVNISDSTFSNNSAANGGALYLAGEAIVSGNAFIGNGDSNNVCGGAIYVNTSSPVSISSNRFEGNDAAKGEAIYIENGDADLSSNTMTADETIYLAGGSVKSNLVFMNNATVKVGLNETVILNASLEDDNGNVIRGGSVTFTANGQSIGSVDISGDNALSLDFTVPEDADADIYISGSYSFDRDGSVSSGKVHPMIRCWFIEGKEGYEELIEAVEAAEDGDVIYGIPGSYIVNGINVLKDITIKANESGSIILDGNKSGMFTVGSNVSLVNLTMIDGGTRGGGFVSVAATATLNLIDSTLKDLNSSGSGGAISVASGGKVNIEGSRFENINSTAGSAILYATGASSVINIRDSSFHNIVQKTTDHTLMQISGTLNLERSNFTNVEGKYQSNWYGGIGATSNGNISVTECQFINMTGGDGAAIYFNSGGNLIVTKSVFMNDKSYRGAIYLGSSSSAKINYNLFIDNDAPSNAKDIFKYKADSNLNADYNFWGSNSQPTESEITTVSNAAYWTVIDLSTFSDTVYQGTSPDIYLKLMGTDGTEIFDLEDAMPEFSFDLTATEGSLSADSLLVKDNNGALTYTPPASVGSVTITATPGPDELVLSVKDSSDLLVVSTDGSNDNPGTLDSPYATIAYALTQVTETRNVIYILNKGEEYRESGLAVSGNVIIRGADEGVTINGENAGSIFVVTGNASIMDLALTGGNNDRGGAIYVNTSSELSISSVEFRDNNAEKGEAIYIENGAVILSGNKMPANETIYIAGGSVNYRLVFMENATVKTLFGETITLTATLTDDEGNAIRGGTVTFTADGETLETVDLSGNSPLEISYVVPAEPSEDILLSGSFSFEGGIVETAVLHPCIFYWFIEDGGRFESLAEAIDAANDGDVIYGTPGTYIAKGIDIGKAITIKANETGAIVLDGDEGQIFNIGSDVTLVNLTLVNGKTTGYGGLVYIDTGSLAAYNSTFKDTVMSTSSTRGAAIYAVGDLVISGCEFRNLTAKQGAAIYQTGTGFSIAIEDSVFDRITGTYDGSLFLFNGNTVISNSSFTNIVGANTSGEYGNIYLTAGDLTIDGCSFINMTGPQGAAIYFVSSYGAVLKISNSLFDNITCLSRGIILSTKESYINYNVFTNVNEGIDITSQYLGNGNIDYNYWGTNEDPSTVINTYAPSKWIIMNLEGIDSDTVYMKDIELTVDFNHYIEDGEVKELEGSLNREFTVIFSSNAGEFDEYEVNTTGGIASVVYSPALGENKITARAFDSEISIVFNAIEPLGDQISMEMDDENRLIVTIMDEEGNGLAGKTVDLLIDNRTLSGITDEEGKAIISLDDLDDGAYSAKISFKDPVYDDILIDTFLVVKSNEIPVDVPVAANASIELSIVDGKVIAKLTDLDGNPLADKEINVTVNGEPEEGTRTDSEGVWSIELSANSTVAVSYIDLNGAEAKASIVYVENNNTEEGPEVPVVANASMTVETADGVVIVSLADLDGNPIEGAEIAALVNGKEQSFTTGADGKVSVPVDGNATVELSYTDPANGASIGYTAKVETEVKEVPVEVPVVANATMSVDVKDDAVVATLLDSDGEPIADATVTAVVNGKEQNFTTGADGKVSVPVDGNAIVELSYTDPANGASIGYTAKVETEVKEVPVEVPVVANATMSVDVKDDAVVATLLDSDGEPIADATVAAVVNGKEQNFTTGADGKVSVPVDGNATVELSYTDPANGASVVYSTKVVTVDVPVEVPVEVPVVANASISLYSDNGSSIVASIKDLDGNPIANATVTAVVNGEESNYTADANGLIAFPVFGNTSVEVTYKDSSNATAKASMNLTVIDNFIEINKTIEVPPVRTETSIVYEDMNTIAVSTLDGRIGEYFRVKLVDADGKPLSNRLVQIGFNGRVYNKTSDENGTAELQINLAYKGTYTFAIAYLGDQYYNASFVVAKIKVSEQTPKLTAPSKTYKASAKTKTLTATFKTCEGTAISGKTIKFTVNGKTYSAKTNAKGVATVKVSLNKKGTYSFTAKYAGDFTYKAVTASGKLTIK